MNLFLQLLIWYVPGLVLPAVMRWIFCREEGKRFFCASPITYIIGILSACTGWSGAIAGLIVLLIFGIADIYNRLERSWFTRPICDPDK